MMKKLKRMKIDDNYVIKFHEEVTVNSTKKRGKLVHVRYQGTARIYSVLTEDGFTVYLKDSELTFLRPEVASAQGIDGRLLGK